MTATDPVEQRRQAQSWCDRFEENNRKWLKTTIATLGPDGEPKIEYEDVDASIIPPRPRLYGVVGGEAIEKVWKERGFRGEGREERGEGGEVKPRPVGEHG